jgi:tetratricopeptide (TPR) repeat protein
MKTIFMFMNLIIIKMKNPVLYLLFFIHAFTFSNQASAQNSGTKIGATDTTLIYSKSRKAVDSLTSAIQHQTDNSSLARLYFLRGVEQEKLTHADSALDDYTNAITLYPELKKAYVNRATLYERKNELTNAIKDDETAITLYEDDKVKLGYLYGRIGLMQWVLKHYPEALAADSMAVQLDIGNGFALVNMGFAHFAAKNYEQAIRDFTAGMESYKDDPGRLSIIVAARANAKRNLKRYSDAILDYLNSLSINPKNKPARWNLALSYRLTGNYQTSETEYNKTIEMFAGDNKNLAKLYDEKAMLETERHKYQAAIQDDSLAISFNSKYGQAYETQANAYMQNADFQLAIDTYLLALNYFGDNKYEFSPINDAIAHAYYFQGKFDKSIASSDSAILINGGSVNSFFNRGKSYLKLKDNEHAMADFRKVLLMDTSKTSYEYAAALFYTGRPDDAIISFQKLNKDTNSDYLMQIHNYNTACLFALMNKPVEAISFLKKSIDAGYSKRYALADPDMENIKNKREFKDLMNRAK